MNKVIIDSLSKLPEVTDLMCFLNCTPEDALLTFREYTGMSADTVYTYTRPTDGKVQHWVAATMIPLPSVCEWEA